jgi:hypothetical protein
MTGGERVRVCRRCARRVYSLSALPRGEAEALIESTEGRPHSVMYQRADGTVMAGDCPIGLRDRRIRRVALLAVGAGVLVLGLVSLSKPTPPIAHQESSLARVQDGPPPVPSASESSAYPAVVPVPGPTTSDASTSAVAAEIPPTPPRISASPARPRLDAATASDQREVPASTDAGLKATGITRVVLERTLCFGSCPEYTVAIDADGTVTYQGKSFVRVHGKQVRHVDANLAQGLFEHVASAGFFDMKESYVVPVTDQPSAILTVTMGGHTKTVRDYPPCHGGSSDSLSWPGAPPALCALEKEVDQVAVTDDWVECRVDGGPSYCEKM